MICDQALGMLSPPAQSCFMLEPNNIKDVQHTEYIQSIEHGVTSLVQNYQKCGVVTTFNILIH